MDTKYCTTSWIFVDNGISCESVSLKRYHFMVPWTCTVWMIYRSSPVHAFGGVTRMPFGCLWSINAIKRDPSDSLESYEIRDWKNNIQIRHIDIFMRDWPSDIPRNFLSKFIVKIFNQFFYRYFLCKLWDHFLIWNDFRDLRSIIRKETFWEFEN